MTHLLFPANSSAFPCCHSSLLRSTIIRRPLPSVNLPREVILGEKSGPQAQPKVSVGGVNSD